MAAEAPRRRTVLAALDTSAAARPVLETALGLAELTGATVEAVHIRDGPVDTPEGLTTHEDVPLQVLHGPVHASLLAAVAQPAAILAVVGARATPGGRRPVGRTALGVLEHTNKPIAVVPPEAVGISPRPFRRLLIPLEGSEQSSRPIAEALNPLMVADIEVIVLHVFTTATAPRVLDRPVRDLSLWGDEFLARFCPEATRIELRSGPIADRVAEVTRDEEADLVVLSWSQDSSPGHAAVIRDVLARSHIPVLLIPVGNGSPAI
jgi:nucleotide-binding universal stress UspA family protein